MANPIQPLDLGAPPTGFVGMNPGVDLCGTRLRNGRKQLPDIFQELHTLDSVIAPALSERRSPR